MKIEYLPEGCPDCPLLRLFDAFGDDVRDLVRCFEKLQRGAARSIALHDLPFLEAVDGIAVTAESGGESLGVVQTQSGSFVWRQTAARWTEIAELAEPFSDSGLPARHQWLDEDSGISVLLTSSADGSW